MVVLEAEIVSAIRDSCLYRMRALSVHISSASLACDADLLFVHNCRVVGVVYTRRPFLAGSARSQWTKDKNQLYSGRTSRYCDLRSRANSHKLFQLSVVVVRS